MIASRALDAGWKAWQMPKTDPNKIFWATQYNRLLDRLDPPARASVERRVREKIKYYSAGRQQNIQACQETEEAAQ